MLLRDIVLYASVSVAQVVDGRSMFDLDQEVISQPIVVDPLTITLQVEATISRPAEIAMVDVLVTGSGMTEMAAWKKGNDSANQIEYLLNGFAELNSTPAESWTRSRIHLRTRNHNDETYGGSEDLEAESPPGPLKVTTLFSIRFNEVDGFEDFVRMLTHNEGASAEYVAWELTEQTLADLKDDLRRKAINKLITAGEDYARALGKTDVKLLDFEELDTFIVTKPDRHEWYMDDINLVRQDVEIRTWVKGKFSTA